MEKRRIKLIVLVVSLAVLLTALLVAALWLAFGKGGKAPASAQTEPTETTPLRVRGDNRHY